jgi:hypothetical protein
MNIPRFAEPDTEPKLDDCYCYWCEKEKPEDEMTGEPELCTACLDRMKERDRKWDVHFTVIKNWLGKILLDNKTPVSYDAMVHLEAIREYIKNL